MRLRDKLRMLWHKRMEMTFTESGKPTYFAYKSRRQLWHDLRTPKYDSTGWTVVDDEWLRSLDKRERK